MSIRTIHRDIVGGFIFSNDNKLLLGKNRKGGVYEGSFVVPGGGVEEGETTELALRREMLEETGIDTLNCRVIFLHNSSGEHEKTLKDTGETVIVKMTFFNYRIDIDQVAESIAIKAEDDWSDVHWFDISELQDADLGAATRKSLVTMGVIEV